MFTALTVSKHIDKARAGLTPSGPRGKENKMDDYRVEITYKDIRKKVIFYFTRLPAFARFCAVCVGDKQAADADFALTADLAAECSKVNTLAIQYGLSPNGAAMIRDLYNYNRIVKGDPYHISINGVNYTCRPVISISTRKRAD